MAALNHGSVYATNAPGSPAQYDPDAPLELHARDKMTGEIRYSITDELASYSSLKLADIGGRRWCFAFARGGLVGFEPKTGKERYRYPFRSRAVLEYLT